MISDEEMQRMQRCKHCRLPIVWATPTMKWITADDGYKRCNTADQMARHFLICSNNSDGHDVDEEEARRRSEYVQQRSTESANRWIYE
jgi:hypothetical protein